MNSHIEATMYTGVDRMDPVAPLWNIYTRAVRGKDSGGESDPEYVTDFANFKDVTRSWREQYPTPQLTPKTQVNLISLLEL